MRDRTIEAAHAVAAGASNRVEGGAWFGMTGLPTEGRRRVAIDGISPQVDGGRFPVKAIIGDRVPIHVDAFPDGHDEIQVRLRHRPPGASEWAEIEMAGPDNDGWTAELSLTAIGRHAYDVAAWIDDWGSWQRDMRIRVDEDVVTTVDLEIGSRLVTAAAARASGSDAARLASLATALGSQERAAAVSTALGDELSDLMDRHPDRRFETNLSQRLDIVVDPTHARFGAWYELFPRSMSTEPGRHGTLRDVIGRLDHISDLGFDVLYLPPIHPIGQSHRKGPNDSLTAGPDDPGVPWAIGDAGGGHTTIHPELGDIDDFEALVEAARARGIRVALDLAFQASPDHPWTEAHRDWFRERPDGTIQYAENPPKKYQDALPLDFETDNWQGLWRESLAVVRYWMDHGVRIFRVDNPHTKPFAFWEWLIDDVKATDPDVIFLAEAFTRPKVMYRLAKLGFSQSYTYFTWRNERAQLERYFEEITRPPVSHTFRANLFTNTPDILHGYLQEGGRAGFEVRLVLAATLGASYGVYGPPFELQEATPRKQGSEEYLDSEKYQLRHWDLDDPDSLAPLMGRLNAVRRAHPALQTDERLSFHPSSDDAVIAYTKQDASGEDIVLVVVNLDPHAAHRTTVQLDGEAVGLPVGPIDGKALLGGSGSGVHIGGDGLEIALDPDRSPFALFALTTPAAV